MRPGKLRLPFTSRCGAWPRIWCRGAPTRFFAGSEGTDENRIAVLNYPAA